MFLDLHDGMDKGGDGFFVVEQRYMITMVKNQAKDYLAKRSYEINVAEIWKSNDMELPGMLWLDDIFKLLTEDEEEIFLWHYIWDLPLWKVAVQMNITYGAARARNRELRRGRAQKIFSCNIWAIHIYIITNFEPKT